MANEISLTTNLTSTNGYVKVNRQVGSVQIDQAAEGKVELTQAIGTTPEPISVGGLTTPGVCLLRNTDDTDIIYIGPIVSSGGSMETFIELKPGEPCAFRLGVVDPYAKSSANNPILDISILED